MIRSSDSPLLVTLFFALCAGSGSGFAQNTAAAPQPGQLLAGSLVKVGSYVASDLTSKLSNGWLSQGLLKGLYDPKCSVDVYHFEYSTAGARDEPTISSAALMIPTGADASCQGPRPVVLYAHGQKNLQFFNIADLTSSINEEGVLVALAYATRGYTVIAPNYAGYDPSTLGYHPYLNADQQSKEMLDALTAGQAALAATGSARSGKLFVAGYSEGGYVAMATHRALQAAGITVTASAPMSGPYALSASVDAGFMGQVGQGAAEQFVMLASSYQHAYGNLYSVPTEMFEPKYASAIDSLPATVGVDILQAQGQLPPSGAVFNSMPPPPALASITPATEPRNLASVFTMGFGPDNLVTNSYRLDYLVDAASAPDGGFPNTTTVLPPEQPKNGLRIDLKINDLRNWSPAAPMLLCAGNSDPVVFYLNTQLMQAYWALSAPESPVTSLDVDSSPFNGDPYQAIKAGFAAAKDAIEVEAFFKGENRRTAVLDQYHGVLVAAFCTRASRSFFDGH